MVFIKLLFWHAKRNREHFPASLNSPSRNPSPEFIFCASISPYGHRKLSEPSFVIVDSSMSAYFMLKWIQQLEYFSWLSVTHLLKTSVTFRCQLSICRVSSFISCSMKSHKNSSFKYTTLISSNHHLFSLLFLLIL